MSGEFTAAQRVAAVDRPRRGLRTYLRHWRRLVEFFCWVDFVYDHRNGNRLYYVQQIYLRIGRWQYGFCRASNAWNMQVFIYDHRCWLLPADSRWWLP